MKKVLNVYKPVGTTPLAVVKKLKQQFPKLKNKKVSYAGRLDPMAEGVLLLLVETENKNRRQYEKLDKDYYFEVLFGVSTDSYDILGKITKTSFLKLNKKFIKNLNYQVQLFKGKQKQSYPAYCAYHYQGRPLFYWTRQGKLNQVNIPKKDIFVKKFKFLNYYQINALELKKYIFSNILKVDGDFRQTEILKQWQKFFNNNNVGAFAVGCFTIACSSGTYIRSIVNDLANKLKTQALTLKIKRTRVGDYQLKDSIKLSGYFKDNPVNG